MPRISSVTILALLVLFAGYDDRSKKSGSNMATQAAQKVTKLTDADQQRLREQRAVVEKYPAAFVQDLKMEWVMVEDPFGRDPAVRVPGTTVIVFPMTMISKRIERGEQVDVFQLFNAVAAQIADIQQRGG